MELRIKLCLFVVLICAVFSAGDTDDEHENDDDPFVPTHEWQTVHKGKKIPKGLHIRINLETGITEAKLLDDKEEKDDGAKTALTIAVEENAGDLNGKSAVHQLKEALKNIKDDYDVKSETILKRIDKFKSYEELKKDLSELNLHPKADTEVLKELIDKHNELTDPKIYDDDHDDVVLVLEILEYLVHQYDNANEFVSLNGFESIIYKNLNSTVKEIKVETLKLLGSCSQNNMKVKIYALETGTLDILLRLLALEDDISLRQRGFFALSAILRGFPRAQLKFVQSAGVSVFFKLFESKDLKLHLRLVTLICDLLEEESFARNNIEKPDNTFTIQQYEKVNLKKHLIEQGYCENVNDLLIRCIAVDPNDHDSVEKILYALNNIIDDCSVKSMVKVNEILENLQSMYEKLASKKNNTDDLQYFTMLFNLTRQLVKKISRNFKSEL